MQSLLDTFTKTPILVLLVGASFSVSNAELQNNDPQSAASHLTEELLRVTNTILRSDPLDTLSLSAGSALVEIAAEVSPNDPDVWRAWIELGSLADRSSMRQRGTKELLRLSPNETPVQLSRFRDAIDTLNTAEERVSLYERLLSPETKSKLDTGVASRLAFDAAMLHRQLGDTHQFARWLAESVALDPTFSEGMALAAGFFGDESADAYRRVELLTSLMLSNMRDVTTQVSLAELLMSFGAYEAAGRIYELALDEKGQDTNSVSNQLLADMVMCHWAARDVETALSILSKRQRETDDTFRNNIRKQQPRMTPLELARLHAPLAPKLATVQAAIFADNSLVESKDAINAALESFSLISLLYQKEGEVANSRVAELSLQAAWVALWLGDQVDKARELMNQANSFVSTSANDKNRLEGWVALRLGELAIAEDYFALVTPQDDATIAGVATLRLKQGREQEAAQLYLQLARDSAGTLIGVWSRNQLEKILNQQVQVNADANALNTLIKEIPSSIDGYASDPRSLFVMHIKPLSTSVGPYEQILIRIEITNKGVIPLAIAQMGPIQPLVLIEVQAEIAGVETSTLVPMIVPIDRMLVLKPRQRFEVVADLRKSSVGGVFNNWPLRGGMLRIRAMTNFTARETTLSDGTKKFVYKTSRLGTEAISDEIRVNGVRLTDLWLAGAIENVKEMDAPSDLVSFAMLTWAVSHGTEVQVVKPPIPPPPGEEPEPIPDGESHPLIAEATTTLLMTFPSLNKTQQAWILSVMSDDPSLLAIATMANNNPDKLKSIGWMIRFVTPEVKDEALDDLYLLSSMQDDDPQVRTVAKWVYRFVEQVVKNRADELLGTSEISSLP
ncbi:MAG: hypothetical protein QGF07_00220 [Phycisphaerales bacterium]|nr:hypothetical protein [Phycisphaerales bacterium]